MRVFFDTSAFVKRYVEETGSVQVLDLSGRALEFTGQGFDHFG